MTKWPGGFPRHTPGVSQDCLSERGAVSSTHFSARQLPFRHLSPRLRIMFCFMYSKLNICIYTSTQARSGPRFIAIGGTLGHFWAPLGPLWASLGPYGPGPCGQGPCGPPWVLVGPAKPLWARNLLAPPGPQALMATPVHVYIYIYI